MAGSIIKKTYSRLQFLYRKRDYLAQHTKRLPVMALIQCHFDYACSFWNHGLPQVCTNKLQTTQNKIIRFVLNLESMTHIDPVHFEFLEWLPVCKKVKYIILWHIFKISNGLTPEYMVEHFTS